MDWERVKERLEAVLQSPMQISLIPEADWEHLAEEQAENLESFSRSVVRGQDVLFYLSKEHKDIRILQVSKAKLTSSERKLVELTVESKMTLEKNSGESFYLKMNERRTN
ncbi:hypothetical protein [Paenibacillus sp. Soil787]|uniref:hypothetical protein n=1 Tax=Paenibacillus sp. Soil787 TaxID=1736411 RepID=UPI000A9B64BD|nr:hypothetical protein [Paenibacillus sp. Soil787]